MKNPTGNSSTVDSQKILENEKQHQAEPKPPRAQRDHLAQPFNPTRAARLAAPSRRAHAGGAHQNAQPSRAAMQDLVREDRHQHRVWHADETDQAEQQQDRADRTGVPAKAKPSMMFSSGEPWVASFAGRSMRISSNPTMTAM